MSNWVNSTWFQDQAAYGFKFPVGCAAPPEGLGPLSKAEAMKEEIKAFLFSQSHPRYLPGPKNEYPPLHLLSGYEQFKDNFEAKYEVNVDKLYRDKMFWL